MASDMVIDGEVVHVDASPHFGMETPDEPRAVTARAALGEWLYENYKGNSRSSAADHIGYPCYVTGTSETGRSLEGRERDTSRLRGGVTFWRWCQRYGLDPLVDVTRRHVIAWVNAVHAARKSNGQPLSEVTQGQMVSFVSSFYDYCATQGYVQANPVMVNRKNHSLHTSTSTSPTRSLSADEVAGLQHAADHDPGRLTNPLRSAAIVALLFGSGMRVSEMTGAKLDDLSWLDGRRVITVKGKGDKSRVLRLPGFVQRRMDAYLRDRASETGGAVARVGSVSSRHEPLIAVWKRSGGWGSIDRSDVAKLLKRLAEVAGIADPGSVTPHVARHTWVTAARRAGAEDSAIQNTMGHASGDTTSRYGQHADDAVGRAVESVADAYGIDCDQ